MNSGNRGTGSILDSVRRELSTDAGQPEQRGNTLSERKPPSDFWLNVGITLKGAGKDGEDLFVSLPVGLALDDMKPVAVKGQNQDWIQLGQAKNALLASIQQAAANLQPGDRIDVPELSVQIFRRNEPAQQGSAESNPIVAAMLAALGAKAA